MNIQTLIDKADAADKAELTILHNAYVEALHTLKDQGGEANIRAYRAARAALDDLVKKLSEKYFPEQADATVFANRMEALAHLRRLGYKISKSKLYKDCKAGLVRLQSDGSVLEKDLRRYVRLVGLDKPADAAVSDAEKMATRKTAAEVEKLLLQKEKLEFDLDVMRKKYMPRADHEMEMASHIAVLSASMDQLLSEVLSDAARVFGGDTAKLPDVLEAAKGKKVRMFNRLAETAFEVEIYESREATS